jgi:hypothetical protein
LVGKVVVDAIVVGVARTVVTDATVVDGAFVAVVARTVVAVSFEGDFVPGVVEAGVEEIDEGVDFAVSVDPGEIDGPAAGPVGAFSTIAA